MNPLYDLVIIGVIVAMVLVNLYSLPKPSRARRTYLSDLVQQFKATTSLRQDSSLPSHGLPHILQD